MTRPRFLPLRYTPPQERGGHPAPLARTPRPRPPVLGVLLIAAALCALVEAAVILALVVTR